MARQRKTLRTLTPIARDLAELQNDLERITRRINKMVVRLRDVEDDAAQWNALPDVQAQHARAQSFKLTKGRPGVTHGISDLARSSVSWEDLDAARSR